MTTTKTLAEQIVTAIKKIAETNHYLVGLNVALVSTNDLDDAEQILITEENAKRLKRADICFIVIHEAKKQLAAKNAVAAPVLQRKATAETKRLEYRKATAKETKRLKYLHGELRAERISYGDLVELQQLLDTVIAPDDVELLEAAGVPEHDDAPVLLDPFTTATK
ncbi:MAG: hypothetical protein GZ088_09510 [Acidipila sp.]|nr:hypothetical protein [Acidipila sp.]